MASYSEEFQLLGGSLGFGSAPRRPPWARAEATFIRLCDCCGDCVDACPERILVNGRGGYPQVDFSRGGCTFCAECVRVCRRGGLQRHAGDPWDLKAYIARSCLAHHDQACDACGEHCPLSAIHFRQQVGGPPIPMLDQGLCTGCGHCVSVCPSSAISIYASLHEGGLLS
jgi:ferredoxin-type protein NapF